MHSIGRNQKETTPAITILSTGRLRKVPVKFDPYLTKMSNDNKQRKGISRQYKKKDKPELNKKKGESTSGSIDLSAATLKANETTLKPNKKVPKIDLSCRPKKPTAADDHDEAKIKRRRHYTVAYELADSADPIHEPIDVKRRRYHSVDEQATQIQEQHSVSNEMENSTGQDEDIPDVTEWSSDQIFNYFNEKFPEDAHALKDQKINGRSIYLLQRDDLLKEFNLKVGPALEIYALILKLKSKKIQ